VKGSEWKKLLRVGSLKSKKNRKTFSLFKTRAFFNHHKVISLFSQFSSRVTFCMFFLRYQEKKRKTIEAKTSTNTIDYQKKSFHFMTFVLISFDDGKF
jgi:hypothetical protein